MQAQSETVIKERLCNIKMGQGTVGATPRDLQAAIKNKHDQISLQDLLSQQLANLRSRAKGDEDSNYSSKSFLNSTQISEMMYNNCWIDLEGHKGASRNKDDSSVNHSSSRGSEGHIKDEDKYKSKSDINEDDDRVGMDISRYKFFDLQMVNYMWEGQNAIILMIFDVSQRV